MSHLSAFRPGIARPAVRIGPGLRASALLHAGLALGVCVLALAQVPSSPEPAPEASIEVMFGANAETSAATGAAASKPGEATAVATAAARTAAGGAAGLDFRRDDTALIEARADPGNRAPHYPDAAQARGEAGLVVWRVALDSDGRVDHLTLMHGSGFSDLDESSRLALLRWRYVPAKRDGVSVASSIDVSIDFVLSRAPIEAGL